MAIVCTPVRSRRGGFTLVELLVVVAIISVLVALLVPSLRAAKEQSKTVACMSNVKQIGTCLAMYLSDNTYTYPVSQYEYQRASSWVYAIADLMGTQRMPGSAGDPYAPLVSRTMFRCPSAVGAYGDCHYGVHPRIFASCGWGDPVLGGNFKPYVAGKLTAPSETAILWDGSQQLFDGGWNHPGSVDEVGYNIDSSGIYWHGFVDGHAGWSDSDPICNYGRNDDSVNGGDPNRGMMRWRHNNNKTINVLLADGHAENKALSNGPSTVYGGQAFDGGSFKQGMLMLVNP